MTHYLEGFIDGILILSARGEWIHANECGYRICNQMNKRGSNSNSVPEEIRSICQSFIKSWNLFPGKTIIFHDEIVTGKSTAFRIRVQWLNLTQFESPCLLVTMENQCQAVEIKAIAEAQKYGLTPGETKVWLLYRANYSYKQIAAELYITLNTVKKHMKNIHAKRREIFVKDE